MSVKVFYVPFSYRGSTKALLKMSADKILGPDFSKILYIAPTPRKVRDAQRIFHAIKGDCYIPPEMLTIKQLSRKLYSLHGDKHIIPRQLIPVIIAKISDRGIGFASAIADFIREIKQYHPRKSIDTVAEELYTVFCDFGTPEEISRRAMEAFDIFKTYQGISEKESVLDEDDVMALCPHLIQEHKWTPDILILDGFYELTRTEESILKALIENTKDIFVSIPHDNNLLDVTSSYSSFLNNNFNIETVFFATNVAVTDTCYQPHSGAEEEVEGIARNIKHHFISGKITDLEKVIVAFPELSEYSDIVERIFRRYGIPYVISISKPSKRTRPFLDALALLESVADDYPRLPFSRFLTSPCFKNTPSVLKDWIPNLSVGSGVIKGKDAWLDLPEVVRNQSKEERSTVGSFCAEIAKGLKWIFKKVTPLESIKNSGNFSQYYEVISELLNDLDFSSVVDQEEGIKDQILEISKDLSLLDTLVLRHLSPYNGKATSSLNEYIDALRFVMSATEKEQEGSGVQVMSLFEMRGIEAEHLYLGGLKEGNLPSKPDIDYLLPDSVRTEFGLINLKKYLLLQKFLFFRTIQSSKNVVLSYPLMENDRFFLPSPLLPWNKETQEKVSGIFSREEEFLRKGIKPFSSYITQIEDADSRFLRRTFGEKSYINVTDIDYYRNCPRRFFIERVLHLEPLEIKEYKIEAMLLGNIVHEIMQFLFTKSFSDIKDFKREAEKIITNILSRKPLEQYWKSLILDSFLSILPEIHELETNLIGEGYSFMKAEVYVDGEILKGIKLKGKIDRIDRKVQSPKFKVQNSEEIELVTHDASRIKDSVELIDYKTGLAQIRGTQVMTKGASLQLFLYAALMKSMGFNVERVGIYSLKDVHLSWIPAKADRKRGWTMEDYIEVSLRFLEETVSKIRAGDFSASPLEEQTCRNCSERPYCPYIQKTVIS